MPFWSPEGRPIGFYAEGKLKRIDFAGGPPRVLAGAPNPQGGAWNRDGKQLFYIAPDGKLMAATIQAAGQTLERGAPVVLFQTKIVGGGTATRVRPQYAVASDSQRFLINTIADESTASPITIVTNWTRALKK